MLDRQQNRILFKYAMFFYLKNESNLFTWLIEIHRLILLIKSTM